MLTANYKKLREEKGLTQKQLCEELKKFDCYITRGAYAKYETGIRETPVYLIITLCKYYNVSADFLLGLTDEICRIK